MLLCFQTDRLPKSKTQPFMENDPFMRLQQKLAQTIPDPVLISTPAVTSSLARPFESLDLGNEALFPGLPVSSAAPRKQITRVLQQKPSNKITERFDIPIYAQVNNLNFTRKPHLLVSSRSTGNKNVRN